MVLAPAVTAAAITVLAAFLARESLPGLVAVAPAHPKRTGLSFGPARDPDAVYVEWSSECYDSDLLHGPVVASWLCRNTVQTAHTDPWLVESSLSWTRYPPAIDMGAIPASPNAGVLFRWSQDCPEQDLQYGPEAASSMCSVALSGRAISWYDLGYKGTGTRIMSFPPPTGNDYRTGKVGPRGRQTKFWSPLCRESYLAHGAEYASFRCKWDVAALANGLKARASPANTSEDRLHRKGEHDPGSL